MAVIFNKKVKQAGIMDKEEIIDEKVFDDLLYESILTVFRINRQRIPGKYEF
jgi:hypothetical protein